MGYGAFCRRRSFATPNKHINPAALNAPTMRFSTAAPAALFVSIAASPCVESFTNNGMKYRSTLRRQQAAAASVGRLHMAALPSAEESAKALSDYMAKSHEDKLRAVKAAEDKKHSEIQALKKEIDELKAGKGQIVQSTSPIAQLPEGSKEDLVAKLQAYQQFMADYIIKSQEQKLSAVRAAEAATAKKYEEKLLLLGGAPAAPAPAAPPAIAAQTPKLYADRNAKISAAGKAGKSRWGDAEVQRVAGTGSAVAAPPAVAAPAPVAPVKPVTAAATSAVSVSVPPEVVAADHGLRADGGVGGPSLAERVAAGANGASAVVAAATASPISTSLYDKRNAMVSAAGKAGKSRWGEAEVQKSIELAGNALPSASPSVVVVAPTPEVEAADHGLRADGGVSGPSLAERVNLGAQLLGQ